MKDEGCMLRAYRRDIVDLMVQSGEASTFIPALALTYATNPTEVGVTHAPRHGGISNYNFYSLIRYNFDLVTGFSLRATASFYFNWHDSFFTECVIFYLYGFTPLIYWP